MIFLMKIGYWVFSTTMMAYCTDLQDLPPIYPKVAVVISMTIYVVLCILFVVLMVLIYYNNMYEFNRLWKNMCLYFFIEMLIYLGVIWLIYDMYANTSYDWEASLVFITNIHHIGISFPILYLKDTKDLIQELSKLDNLVLVSSFQKFKKLTLADA